MTETLIFFTIIDYQLSPGTQEIRKSSAYISHAELKIFLKEYPYLLSGIESFPTVIIRMIAAIKLTAHAIIAARTEESKPV